MERESIILRCGSSPYEPEQSPEGEDKEAGSRHGLMLSTICDTSRRPHILANLTLTGGKSKATLHLSTIIPADEDIPPVGCSLINCLIR